MIGLSLLAGTYFMADRGEIKHYLPPQSAPTSQPEGDSSAAVDEPGNDGGDADDDDDQDEDEDADEVERVLEKRITEKGENEFKVRWKRYTAEDDTWEPEGNLAGCRCELCIYMPAIDRSLSDCRLADAGS